MTDPTRPAHCRNCGSPAPGAYCPACGQETALHPPSAREFLHEFAGHYVALEGALWRTLKALLVPGKLTLEYFAGRRRQYVLPLRIYLTASLLFFVMIKVIAPQTTVRVAGMDKALAAAQEKTKGTNKLGNDLVQFGFDCEDDLGLCKKMNERYGSLTPERMGAVVRDRLVSLAPYAMFLLLPLFALLTRAAYYKRPHNYGEHLVFALHVHTFFFLAGTIAAAAGLVPVAAIVASLYLAVALGRVFGGRKFALLLRFALVFVVYSVLLALAAIGLAIAALFL